MNNISLASNFFRSSFQIYETGQDWLGLTQKVYNQTHTISEAFDWTIKSGITFYDALSSCGYFKWARVPEEWSNFPELYREFSEKGLNIAEGSLRFIDICRGLYLLRTTPSIDDSLVQRIVLNLINIQRLVLDNFRLSDAKYTNLFYLSLACSLLDNAVRIYSVKKQIKNTLVQIKNNLTSILQNFSFAQLVQKVKYVGHFLGTSLCIIKSLSLYALALMSATVTMYGDLAFKDATLVKPLMVTVTSAYFLANAIQPFARDFFDILQIRRTTVRSIAEWTLAIGSSVPLGYAAATGLGLAPPISQIFRQVLPIIQSSALFLTLIPICHIAINQTFNHLGIPNSKKRFIVQVCVSLLAIAWISLMVKGLGLLLSKKELDLAMGGGTACISPLFLHLATRKIHFFIRYGPLTWQEIKNDLKSIM